METTLAYLWSPVLIAVLALGLGLLVERASGWRLPSALLAPVGLCAATCLAMTVYRLHGTATIAVPLAVVAALGGFVLARRELRERLRPGWAAAAFIAGYVLYVAPSALTGEWTWGGYNFVNDTSVNFIYVNLLAEHGFTKPEGLLSTTTRMQGIGVDLRYPMGAHALLATFQPLSLVGLPALYQPFIAAMAGLTASAMTQLGRRAGAPDAVAALIATLAVAANLVYQYGQHGAIKEIVMMLLLVAAAAATVEGLRARLPVGAAAVVALCLAPALLVFSAAGAAYALVFVAVALVAVLADPGRPSLRRLAALAGTGVAVALVATLASLDDVLTFGRGAGSNFESAAAGEGPAAFGQLVRPLPLEQAAGVWFGQDYRFPLGPGTPLTLQTVLVVLVALLAAVGIVVQARARRPGALILIAATGMTAVLLAPRLSPYADAKLLLLLSPGIVFAAGLGAWSLRSLPRIGPALAVALGLAGGGGVLLSDAIAAHEERFAPTDRLGALEQAAEHAGGGFVLLPEWEEFAKYFTRAIRNNSGTESDSPAVIELRTPGPIFARSFDLDAVTLDYIHRFKGLILRRSPVTSRPPADYRQVFANAYYEVWRRSATPAVVEHLPLQHFDDAIAMPSCQDVKALAGRARAAGDEIVAARRPPIAVLDLRRLPDRPVGWPPDDSRPGTLALQTPGVAHGVLRVPAAGRFRVWLRGSTGRPLHISIDGRPAGAPHAVNTPEQWLAAGELDLTAGTHRVELRRDGGRPVPGDGYDGDIGPLALEPIPARTTLERIQPRDTERLCGREWDWIERVRSER
jgi:hypothetical protein